MSTYGHEETKLEKIGFIGVIGALMFLGVAMLQPVWRGQEMIDQKRNDCAKVGGVMLENKVFMGTIYECSPRYDQGVKL